VTADANTRKTRAIGREFETSRSDCCPMCGAKGGKARRVVRAGDVMACRGCGGWYRVPRPSREELGGIYTRDYYNSWGLQENEASVEATKRATFAPVLDRIEEKIGRPARGRLLDVGAATGILLGAAAERGWEPYALEVNPYAADILREKFGADRVFEDELAGLAQKDMVFEVITMTDVIEHVMDVHATLQRAAKLLTAGGVICITTPRIDSLSRTVLGRQWLHFKEEHIQYFSRKSIVDRLRAAGFEDVTVYGHYKYLTMSYLRRQLETFRHPLLTPLVAVIDTMIPRAWRTRPVRLRCGEMLAIARRDGRL